MKTTASNISSQIRLNTFFVVLGIPLTITFLLYLARLNEVSLPELLIAFVLLLLPWHAYISWRHDGRAELPVFAMLVFMYWLYYGVPLFLEEHVFSTINEPIGHELTQSTITLALLMA